MAKEGVEQVVDHLFRHESGKMVAVLCKIFGLHNLELVEDVVQDTLLDALYHWSYRAIPDNPEGWLMQVAKRKAINILKHRQLANEKMDSISYHYGDGHGMDDIDRVFLDEEIEDSQLRMIFTCCHPHLPDESKIALTLKTLCGFSVKEVSNALLTNEATINKRLYRAKEKIRHGEIPFEVPSGTDLVDRLDSVYLVIYLLFNEGYHSSTKAVPIRKDLCAEAIRLLLLLTKGPMKDQPKVNALLALMLFHAARFDSRIDDRGALVILKDQDRSKWNADFIERGMFFLSNASEGDALSEYHLEAGIAAHHCFAKSFEETNWKGILKMYQTLKRIKNNPVIGLNEAIILGKIEGPEVAIKHLQELEKSKKLGRYYLLPATLGEFYLKTGKKAEAAKKFQEAAALTNSQADRELLDRKLGLCKA